MSAHSPFALFTFMTTVGVAMILRSMLLMPSADEFNPDWVMLVLIYWSIALPERFGVFTAFCVGLLTDVLTGRLLGQYALIYAVISYFAIKQHRRLRQFPMPQQCMFVLLCLLGEQSLVLVIESMQATANRLPFSFWYSVVTGALVWPLVFVVMRTIRMLARMN